MVNWRYIGIAAGLIGAAFFLKRFGMSTLYFFIIATIWVGFLTFLAMKMAE